MPSKKKSCFQITSVTQASQGAANSNTDDTESLDEPRTEDMSSSEIYDMSSSEIYDMSKARDFEPEACDVSLSDDSLHNEGETSGVSAQDAPITLPAVHINPPVCLVTGSVSSVASNAPSSIQTSSVSSSATVSSCSSRFRVIKLDHGTGEPFKRGRWTCTEFYERDTDGSSSGRTVNSLKQASAEKDVLGVAGGPVAVHVGSSTSAAEPHTDSGYLSAPSNPPAELQQQTLGISQQGLGLAAQNAYIKSPSMPLASQPQPLFPGKPVQKPGQIGIPSNQAQMASVASLPLMTPLNQGPSPVMTPAGQGRATHMLGLVPQPVDGRGLPISQSEHVQGLLQQLGISTALGTVSAAAVVKQAPVPLTQPAVTVSVSPLAGVPGVQNVPAVMSSASNAPQSMPKQTLQNPPQGVHGGLLGGLGAQTTPTNFGQLPTSVAQAEENQWKPDGLLQSSVLIGKDAIKPLNPEGLQLPTPAVRSLFGITIPIDGDEDR